MEISSHKMPGLRENAFKHSQGPVIEPIISLNLSGYQAETFGSVLFVMAGFDLCVTCFLLLVTWFTSTSFYMKNCEKLTIYNAIVPDLVTEFYLLIVVAPATFRNSWTIGTRATQWLGFMHSVCMFHSNLAVAFICYIIALSLMDITRFNHANNLKNMWALTLSSLTVTISFCSLPATEDKGYSLLQNWISPSFTVYNQYGGMFTATAMLGIIVPIYVYSIRLLFQARTFFNTNKELITQKANQDLNKVIIFACISFGLVATIIPVVMAPKDVLAMFGCRVLLYVAPMIRALALLFQCPHFRFGIFSAAADTTDDLIILSREELVMKADHMTLAQVLDEDE